MLVRLLGRPIEGDGCSSSPLLVDAEVDFNVGPAVDGIRVGFDWFRGTSRVFVGLKAP